ncbi:hypothetical protein, partial [Paenibacillus chibensis]
PQARAEGGPAGAGGRSPQEAGAERPASGPAAASVQPQGTPADRPPAAGPGLKAAASDKPPQEEQRSAAMDRLLAARKRNSR